MPNEPEPTPAEKAALKAIAPHLNRRHDDEGTPYLEWPEWSQNEVARTLVSVLRPLFEAESLEIQAGIYQATPDRKTTYGDVGHQLSEHARLTREEYDEARIRAARQSGEGQR